MNMNKEDKLINKKGLITYDELLLNFLELLDKYSNEEEIKEFEKENEK